MSPTYNPLNVQSNPYLQHPLSAAFPAMSEADHSTLTADIKQHGQRDAITISDGMVLDGWHRYQSCIALGLQPRFETLRDAIDPVAFVKSHNLHRRHLTGSQRAEAVTACCEWAGIGSNQHPVGAMELGSTPQTLASMAKDADVSTKTIQHAKTVHAAGLGDAVRDGKVTARVAAQIAKLPEHQRAAAVENPQTLKMSKPSLESEQTTVEIVTMTRAERDELMALVEEAHADQKALETVLDADDQLAEAARQIKMLTAQVEALQGRFYGVQNEKNEAIRQVKSLQRQVAKLEKEKEQNTVKLCSAGMPI